jgi:tetratricopeptide (TPR) repeat protein
MPHRAAAGPPPRASSFPALHRVALALVLALLALFALRQVSSPDIGFHLKAGEQMLAGEGWPRTDRFTYTVAGRPYIDTSWGYQIVLAVVHRAAGSTGIVLLHVALTFATFALLALAAGNGGGRLPALLLLGGLAAEPRFEARPEVLSYALLALVLYLLRRRAAGRGVRLWLLPAIFLVWVNAHGLVVLGWAALACFAVGTWLCNRRPDVPLLRWSAASVLAGLVNPYGWKGLLFPLELATRLRAENEFAQNIGEFFSPLFYARSEQLAFYVLPLACTFAFAAITAAALPTLWRGRRFADVLLAFVFLPLSLAMIRNVPALVVACLPGCIEAARIARVPPALVSRAGRVLVPVLLLVTVVLGARVRTDAYWVSSRRLERFGTGWNALALPIEAARYVRDAGLEGRVLNHLNFGAWLAWSLDRPVFIDGRLEVMGEALYAEYRRALDSPAGLERAVQAYDVRWIVFPHRLRPDLATGLSRSSAWRLVYADAVAVVFARPDAPVEPDETARRIERAAAPPVDLSALPGLGARPRPSPLARWLSGLTRVQRYPAEAFGRGVLHFQRGEALPAAAAFAEAIRESDGRFHEIYNNLGAALFAAGRWAEAGACYRLYLDDLPWYRHEARRRAEARLAEIAARPRD